MGANPTQASAVALFLIAFTVIAAGFAADISIPVVIVGLAILGGSCMLFLKCKPWEHRED